ncbi:uncharacterized protein V6R79_019391 [Siganus canaliculatus]
MVSSCCLSCINNNIISVYYRKTPAASKPTNPLSNLSTHSASTRTRIVFALQEEATSGMTDNLRPFHLSCSLARSGATED